MALTENELREITDRLVIMFDKLEDDILIELGKFIKRNDSESALYNIKLAKNLGISQAKVRKLINETLDKIPVAIEEVFKDMANVSDTRELKEYLKNDYEPVPLQDSELLSRLIDNHINAANEYIQHYMRSIGFAGTSIQQAFLQATDYVSLQTATGALSYDQAVANATRDIAHKGLTTIAYSSGATIDMQSGVRRIVLTEGNQMALRLTEERVIENGVEYVEISRHSGARPEHARWQGRVIKYKDLRSITGYGKVDGLGGANCRHTFHPFFKNSVKAPKEPEPKPIEYQDKVYTRYEAEQKQRYYERGIRNIKKEILILENAKADTKQAYMKLADWESRYKEFSSAMHLRNKTERTRIY